MRTHVPSKKEVDHAVEDIWAFIEAGDSAVLPKEETVRIMRCLRHYRDLRQELAKFAEG